MRNFHSILVVLIGITLSGCEAPRHNPYDPKSEIFVGYDELLGTIDGEVTMLNSTPLEGVLVLSIPENYGTIRGAITDSAGNYFIEDIIADHYQVVCAPGGFVPDTIELEVLNLEGVTADFRLNAYPHIHSFDLTTRFVYDGPPIQPPSHYELSAVTYVYEPDGPGTIDSVLLKTTEEDIYFELDPNPALSKDDTIYYSVDILEEDLPDGSLLLGTAKWDHYYCEVKDNREASNQTMPSTLTRIFETYPDPWSPVNEPVYADTLVLIWLPFGAQYFFTYTAEIFHASTNNLLWDSTGISSIEESVVAGDILDAGFYYWRLTVMDEFGNTTRSGDAPFEMVE